MRRDAALGGGVEISDVNAHYLKAGWLTAEKLGRGYACLIPARLGLLSGPVRQTVEDRQGSQISPERSPGAGLLSTIGVRASHRAHKGE
jgi:hypothetical protein